MGSRHTTDKTSGVIFLAFMILSLKKFPLVSLYYFVKLFGEVYLEQIVLGLYHRVCL